MMKRYFFYLCISILFVSTATAQKNNADIDKIKNNAILNIQSQYSLYKNIALDIWNFSEVGYKEVKSSALLQKALRDNGFTVQTGVADIPTAFVATYGSGQPVIGILAEFDALPGLSQEAIPQRKSISGKGAGHACGHHLFGTGSVAAGIAIKKLIEEKRIKGTIKVFGCPAEEGGSGKVYMVRAGLFKDVDVAIHWHPDDENSITMMSALANKSGITFGALPPSVIT